MNRESKPTRRETKALRPIPENERHTILMGGVDIPVPYVAAWSSEFPNVKVAPEPLLGGKPALFRASGRRGEGKPVLGKMDLGRQRLCIIRGVCQVCGGQIVGPAWYVQLEEHAVLVDGRTVFAIREPAACTHCMLVSLQVCPALQSLKPRIISVKRSILLKTLTIPPIGGVGPLKEDGPELVNASVENAVVGYLKVVPVELDASYSTEAFIRGMPRDGGLLGKARRV